MPFGSILLEMTEDRILVQVRAGNHAEEGIFGPTDYDNAWFWGRDKFKDLNELRAQDEVNGEPSTEPSGSEESEPEQPADTTEPSGSEESEPEQPADTTEPSGSEESEPEQPAEPVTGESLLDETDPGDETAAPSTDPAASDEAVNTSDTEPAPPAGPVIAVLYDAPDTSTYRGVHVVVGGDEAVFNVGDYDDDLQTAISFASRHGEPQFDPNVQQFVIDRSRKVEADFQRAAGEPSSEN